MAKDLVYTTFRPGELEATIRAQVPGQEEFTLTVPVQTNGNGQVKEHTFAVSFPDRQSGTCRYERCGPRYHKFHFAYGDGSQMPFQRYFERLAGYLPTIEAKGRELAEACFREAIQRERREYFQRASEPSDGSRKRRPEKYSLKPARAKEWAGLYAVGRLREETFFQESVLFDSLEKANAQWRQCGDPRLVVACCNRLDRCFEVPKFNPLYAEYEMRPQFLGKEKPTP